MAVLYVRRPMLECRHAADCGTELLSEPDVLRSRYSYPRRCGAVGAPEAEFASYNRLSRDKAGYSMHTRLSCLASDFRLPVPWADLYGLARSLVAAGPLLALLCTN